VILLGQMRGQESHRGEVDFALGQPIENDGKLAGRPRCLDAIEGLVLREPEDLSAVREEGRVAGAQIEAACRTPRDGR
jgi:hypothetical protein